MRPSRWGLAGFVLLATAATAAACNVPVHRYALERWPAGVFDLVILHDEPLTPEQQAVVERLEDRSALEPGAGNFAVRLMKVEPLEPAEQVDAEADTPDATPDAESVDTESPNPASNGTSEQHEPLADEAQLMWKRLDKPALPRMVLRYPWVPPEANLFWSAPLTVEAADRFIDSPKRQRIVEQLLGGDVAVWVFLASGDEEQDAAALKTLRGRLEELEDLIEYPPTAEFTVAPRGAPMASGAPLGSGPEADVAAPEPPPVTFSVVELSRDNPAEAALVDMLMHSEPDLHEYADKPMAFATFGRGRSLFALVGGGINPANIDDVCAFLTGPCACTIKQANPGIDLMIAADWDAALAEQWEDTAAAYQEEPLIGLATVAEAAEPESVAEVESGETPDASPDAAAENRTAATDTNPPESPTAQPAPPSPPVVPAQARAETEMAPSHPMMRNTAIAVGALAVVALGLGAVMAFRAKG